MPAHDYTDFFDAQKTDAAAHNAMRSDFAAALRRQLAAMRVTRGSIDSISERLWDVMMQPHRHYHSPVHVLAMFDYAAAAGMQLADAERLAIWFHDSVYEAAAEPGRNESQSAQLLRQMFAGERVDAAVLGRAEQMILSTADHSRDDVPREHHRVMDLDLAGFSAPPEVFDRQSAALRLEFQHVPEAEYNRATAEFLRTLLSRRSIYRTAAFAPREQSARQQVEREIARLTG